MNDNEKRDKINKIKEQIFNLEDELWDLKRSISSYYIYEIWENYGDIDDITIYVLGYMTENEAEEITKKIRDGHLIPLNEEKYKKYEDWLRVDGAIKSLTYVNGYFRGLNEYSKFSMENEEPKTEIDVIQRELEKIRDDITGGILTTKVSDSWCNYGIYGRDAINNDIRRDADE